MVIPSKDIMFVKLCSDSAIEVVQIFRPHRTCVIYLPADHRKNLCKFLCDVNLWSAGTNQKLLRKILKILKLLQTFCDSVQSLHESCEIACKNPSKNQRCCKIHAVTALIAQYLQHLKILRNLSSISIYQILRSLLANSFSSYRYWFEDN